MVRVHSLEDGSVSIITSIFISIWKMLVFVEYENLKLCLLYAFNWWVESLFLLFCFLLIWKYPSSKTMWYLVNTHHRHQYFCITCVCMYNLVHDKVRYVAVILGSCQQEYRSGSHFWHQTLAVLWCRTSARSRRGVLVCGNPNLANFSSDNNAPRPHPKCDTLSPLRSVFNFTFLSVSLIFMYVVLSWLVIGS